MCVKLRPSWLPKATCCQAIPRITEAPGFVIHPATSELAEQLMIDPESLSNENYSGLYDENGDYVPQYCDNPDDIPRGMDMQANSVSTDIVPAPNSAEREAGNETNSSADTNKAE